MKKASCIAILGFILLFCSTASAKECIKDMYGNDVCGYNCLRGSKTTACSSTPNGACMSNSYGEVICDDPPRWVNEQMECIKNGYGHVICGYHCLRGRMSDGAACARTPSGNCMSNSHGRVICDDPKYPTYAQMECIKDGYGQVTCGYDCKRGSSGVGCSSEPDGICLVNQYGKVDCH